MTYDELRDYIDKFDAAGMVNEPVVKALRAVVELHRPEAEEHGQYEKCWNCNLIYPCLTIKVIEKELE